MSSKTSWNIGRVLCASIFISTFLLSYTDFCSASMRSCGNMKEGWNSSCGGVDQDVCCVRDGDEPACFICPWRVATYKLACEPGLETYYAKDNMISAEGWCRTSQDQPPSGHAWLFSNCNYTGHFTDIDTSSCSAPCKQAGAFNFLGLGDNLNKNVSAVKVGANTSVTLFSEKNYTGENLVLKQNTPCLQQTNPSFDKKASSAIVGTPPSPAFDNDIHLISPPSVQYDAQGGYTFIVFGDTRTAQDDSKKEDKIFHKIRNMTHGEVKTELDKIASFSLYTGDLIWRGSNTDYWQEILNQFPANLRSTSTPRIFPVLGNHESWQQAGEGNAMSNYFRAFPYLAQNGVQFHNYAFVIGNSLFVNLCSGVYGNDPTKFDEDDKTWNCKAIESFDKLMQSLDLLYWQLSDRGRRFNNIFVTYHKPSYSTYEHAPLNTNNDPMQTLLRFKSDNPNLKIFVFNGHNHVTELFKPASGVFALVAGGGGAPQKAGIPVKDHGKPMQELFWGAVGGDRYRRINFFRTYIGQNDERVTIEERVLCANDDFAVIDYFKGVGIDNDGSVSYKGSRKYDCGFDQYYDLFE